MADQSKKKVSFNAVECPSCDQLVVDELIHQHLDRCVQMERRPWSPPTGSRPASARPDADAAAQGGSPSPSRKRARTHDSSSLWSSSSSSIVVIPGDSSAHSQPGSSRAKATKPSHPFFQPRSQKLPDKSANDVSRSPKGKVRKVWGDANGSTSSSATSSQLTPEDAVSEATQKDCSDATSLQATASRVSPSDSDAGPAASAKPSGKVNATTFKPLAEVMRPSSLEDFVGQDAAVGPKALLRKLINGTNIPSIILWGPPGCGKTTLAHIISKKSRAQGMRFVPLSAVAAGSKDVKDVVAKAETDQKMFRAKTVLFLDEIHRFNKAQQDVFLPYVENGTITLVGATTENPSFSLNSALLSRCKVIVLEKLSAQNLTTILLRAVDRLGVRLVEDNDVKPDQGLSISRAAVDFLVGISDGDCRAGLNSLETIVTGFQDAESHLITKEEIADSLQRMPILYDRKGDQHYDTISALHKSMRFGKENAALYYLARMLAGGEDPRFVARRLMVFASEDIGLADPSMLSLAAATHQSCEKIGMPECRIMLAHCTVQFCRAPKSRESYDAYGRAESFVKNFSGPHPPIPLTIRNAPTQLMKQLGYAQGEYGSCMPQGLEDVNFFTGPPPSHHK